MLSVDGGWPYFAGDNQPYARYDFATEEIGPFHEVVLRVTDREGATATEKIKVIVGNEMPRIELELTGNRTFYWPGEQVRVSDREDGSFSGGGIGPEQVTVTVQSADAGARSGAGTPEPSGQPPFYSERGPRRISSPRPIGTGAVTGPAPSPRPSSSCCVPRAWRPSASTSTGMHPASTVRWSSS